MKNQQVAAAAVVAGLIIVTALARFTDVPQKIGAQIRGYFGAGPDLIGLRKAPETLAGDAVRALLVRRGLYERSLNPTAGGIDNRFEAQVRDGIVLVLDAATGLMWQKGGSPEEMTHREAALYVERMNSETFAGFGDWRLPTVEEAMSLVEPQAQNGFHIDPEFELRPNFVWTADRAAGGGAWLVYYYDGTLGIEQDGFNAWVRLVR